MLRPGDAPESSEDAQYYVLEKSILVKIAELLGWLIGWVAYCVARAGFHDRADTIIDDAILLRRANPGAVKTIGYLNGKRGLPALRRGELMIHGLIGPEGPFANLGFYATYHVAAPNQMRALALIRRFEWDAIPESLEVAEGELDLPDHGAEGILWVMPGRTYYSKDS